MPKTIMCFELFKFKIVLGQTENPRESVYDFGLIPVHDRGKKNEQTYYTFEISIELSP